MEEKIGQYIGVFLSLLSILLVLTGVYLTVFNILAFSSSKDCRDFTDIESGDNDCKMATVEYFYREEVRHGVALGSLLLVAGLLITKSRKKS